jgi:hypothetical protein
MFVAQRKIGLGMVETDRPPALCIMTGGTLATEAAVVRLLALMALEARGGGLAVGLARLVTSGTRQGNVRAGQGKLGACMVELGRAELDYVSGSPEMLGVAGAALGLGDPRQPAVKVTAGGEVGRDLLVTIEAQARLAAPVMTVVALEALVLVLLVRAGDFTGHEQCLRIHGRSRPRAGQEQEQAENRDGMTWTSPHESASQVNRC